MTRKLGVLHVPLEAGLPGRRAPGTASAMPKINISELTFHIGVVWTGYDRLDLFFHPCSILVP